MQKTELLSIRIIPNAHDHPPGTRADAEAIGEADAGPLSGLTLSGFAVRERRERRP
jgi:hypothetical protein